VITTDCEPADFFFAGPMFMVSEQMRTVLESFHVEVEFFEISTFHKGKPYGKKQFFFANILDCIECFDYDNSIYEATEYGVINIKKLVLQDSKAQGHHLFMVGPIRSANPNSKAVRSIIICASEELATRIVDSELTGVVFSKPEDWQSYPPPMWNARP
jgi:hypothetical protein